MHLKVILSKLVAIPSSLLAKLLSASKALTGERCTEDTELAAQDSSFTAGLSKGDRALTPHFNLSA